MSDQNKKGSREIALNYIEKLGEIDTKEDELRKLKQEATDLKQELDEFKQQRKNDRNKNLGSND
jgi:TfoX/Sxy family transcriptional regulator of competence genes